MLGYTGAAGDESGGTNASYGGLDVYAPDAISALDAFNASVKAHADELAGSWGQSVLRRDGRRNGQNIHQHGSRAWRLSSDDPAKKRLRRRPVALCAGAPLRRAGQYVLCSLLSGRGGPAETFSASIWNTDMQATAPTPYAGILTWTFCPTTIFPRPKRDLRLRGPAGIRGFG